MRIALRTAHIGAASMMLGAAHWDSPQAAVHSDFVGLLLGSGAGILMDDLYRYGARWVRMLQFWAAASKVALLVAGVLMPDLLIPCMWAALIVGSVVSHAPGEVRHFEFWGRSARRSTRV